MNTLIGLTGLIGSGKSLVANYFTKLGVPVIDTDKIAHDITNTNGIAIERISSQFGEEYINKLGALDRVKMRQLIFNNSKLRIELENLLHPIIYEQVLLQIEQCCAIYIIIVVPLLFKSTKYLDLTSRNIFVDCEIAKLIERVKQRDNLSLNEITAILSTQVEREKQLASADDIINNNGDLQTLFDQVKTLHNKYKQLFL